MYTKEEELNVIIDLFVDYATAQEEAITLFKSERQKKYQDQSLLQTFKKKQEVCKGVLERLRSLSMYFNQAYHPNQLQQGGIAEENANEGKRLLAEFKKDPSYTSLMSEIAHNSYFSDVEPALSGIQLPEEVVFDHLAQCFSNGSISKKQFILYDNFFTYLCNDPQYLEIVNQNQPLPSGQLKP